MKHVTIMGKRYIWTKPEWMEVVEIVAGAMSFMCLTILVLGLWG